MPFKKVGDEPSDDGWLPAHCAPMGERLRVEVRDEAGPYKLKSPVERREDGWYSLKTPGGVKLVVPVSRWRRWVGPVT